MSTTGKSFLSLIFVFCVSQIFVEAWVHLDTAVRYALVEKSFNAELEMSFKARKVFEKVDALSKKLKRNKHLQTREEVEFLEMKISLNIEEVMIELRSCVQCLRDKLQDDKVKKVKINSIMKYREHFSWRLTLCVEKAEKSLQNILLELQRFSKVKEKQARKKSKLDENENSEEERNSALKPKNNRKYFIEQNISEVEYGKSTKSWKAAVPEKEENQGDEWENSEEEKNYKEGEEEEENEDEDENSTEEDESDSASEEEKKTKEPKNRKPKKSNGWESNEDEENLDGEDSAEDHEYQIDIGDCTKSQKRMKRPKTERHGKGNNRERYLKNDERDEYNENEYEDNSEERKNYPVSDRDREKKRRNPKLKARKPGEHQKTSSEGYKKEKDFPFESKNSSENIKWKYKSLTETSKIETVPGNGTQCEDPESCNYSHPTDTVDLADVSAEDTKKAKGGDNSVENVNQEPKDENKDEPAETPDDKTTNQAITEGDQATNNLNLTI